jgi:putative transposase
VIKTIQQGLKQDGFDVSISELCQWFEIPRGQNHLGAREAARAAGEVDQQNECRNSI